MREITSPRIRIALLCVAATILATGAFVVAVAEDHPETLEQPLPMTIDLATARHIEIRDASGQPALSADFTDRKADLTGTTKATGHAEIEIEDDARVQELEIKVNDLSASTNYRVVVDGRDVSSFTTDKDGDRALKYKRKIVQ